MPTPDPIDSELPPPLVAAPREFVAWSREQLLREQAESTPTVPLYHYTDETALRSILRLQKFWCFSHEQQTDPQEFEYALEVALRVLTEVSRSDDFFVHALAECLLDMLRVNKLSGPFEFYLFSVSRHRDHGPQWKAYGRDGKGFALGLSPALFQADKEYVDEEANKNLHIGRVVYGDGPTAERHRLTITRAAEITSKVGHAHKEAVRAHGIVPYLQAMAHELLASHVIWNCLTAKETRFEDEREVRGIILNVRNKFEPYRRSHGGRNYIEHEMPLKAPGSIAEILVGPDAPPDAEARMRAILRAEGYSDAIPVQRGHAAIVSGKEVSR
jgi:hypothetical protein